MKPKEIKEKLKNALVNSNIHSPDDPLWLEYSARDLIKHLKKQGLQLKKYTKKNKS